MSVAGARAERAPRFVARLADGTRLEGDEITDWHKPELSPRLAGQPLMEPNRPAVWLMDRRLNPAGVVPAYVEMVSGDCLPGVALGYEAASESPVIGRRDHWIVRPEFALHPPRPVESPRIRVIADFVRRIVWQRRGSGDYRPGTLLLRDGGQVSFTSARLRDGEVVLLQPEGIRRVPFGEIAELHLPERDFWRQSVAVLAVLCPSAQTRLIQIETDDGLVVTSSFDRFAAFAWGSEKISDQWSHGVQPAWSLDLLWVPHARIRIRRMFPFNRIPLTRLPRIEDGATLESTASLWSSQCNRNVRGGPLRCGDVDFGWGFGVHARSRLRFPLPPVPSRLSCDFGLDRIAQGGGCVRARIQTGTAAERMLYEGPPQVGADAAMPIGPISLPPGELLQLEVDPAHSGRPGGADPLFIRDLADWLDPVLECDAAAWTQRIRSEVPGQVPAWNGWTVHTDGDLAWPSRLRESHVNFGSFVQCVDVRRQPLILSRQVNLQAGCTFLLTAVSRVGARDVKPTLQVSVNGQPLDEREIPYRDSWHVEVPPLVFQLNSAAVDAPQQATLEIRQSATADQVPVFWEGLMVTSQLPMLRTLFEDQATLAAVDGGVAGRLVDSPCYAGSASIEVAPQRGCRITLDKPLAIRER
ncbi:MAG: NPCBM/NEW2 domain-containing protein, partial [Planctomycetes bacterium]|nr:NPCBM/NEW2 domain-containing protein [Planctomycetota bacterium]